MNDPVRHITPLPTPTEHAQSAGRPVPNASTLALRPPSNRVERRAIWWWMLQSALLAAAVLAAGAAVSVFWEAARPWLLFGLIPLERV